MSCQWAGYLESSRCISEKERRSYKGPGGSNQGGDARVSLCTLP